MHFLKSIDQFKAEEKSAQNLNKHIQGIQWHCIFAKDKPE